MYNHLNLHIMHINGKIRSIGELRQVTFPDEVKTTRTIVVDFMGALIYDAAKDQHTYREQSIAVDVWGKQASEPKYREGDIVDVLVEFNISESNGRVFNNVRARMVIPPLRK